MNKNQNTVCLSHREDPDGVVSAVLFKNLFELTYPYQFIFQLLIKQILTLKFKNMK